MTNREFVENLWYESSEYDRPMDLETAREDLENFKGEGWDIPEGMTAERFVEIWNELLEENGYA